MSFDLTIKGDKHYSRAVARAPLADFVSQLPRVKANGPRGYVLDDPPKVWMEIDLEDVNREGDNVEPQGQIAATINCIRLHIPYSFLKTGSLERDYLPIAIMIADHLGWQLYDDQNDDPDEPMYPVRRPWWRFWSFLGASLLPCVGLIVWFLRRRSAGLALQTEGKENA